MKGRSPVGERCSCSTCFQAQLVLHGRSFAAVLTGVDEHIRADLGEGGFKEDEVAVVGAPPGALAEQVDRMVERVQAIFQSCERGVEFKGWGSWRDRLRSQ